MNFSYAQAINSVKKSNLKANKQIVLDFLKWKYETQQKANDKTLIKLAMHYITIDKWFKGKSWLEIDEADVTELLFKLRKGKLKQPNNKYYATPSIETYVKDHRQILRWIYNVACINKQQKKNGVVLNFDQAFHNYKFSRNELLEHENEADKEPSIYTKTEMTKLIDKISKSRLDVAVILAIGFDSGIRPKELFNARIKDLVWNDEKKRYYIYVQYPKVSSERRNIDLYNFTNIIKEYLSKNMDYKDFKNGNNDAGEKQLFNIQNVQFTRLVKKYLKEFDMNKTKQFKTYDLRHSSIQHYVDVYRGDFNAMALRYGWSFSKVGERLKGYLARSQCVLPDVTEQAHYDKIADLQNKSVDLENKYGDLFKKYEETIRLFKHLKR